MDLFKYHDKPEDLKGHHEADDIVPQRVWELAHSGKKLTPKQEAVIAKNADTAYMYARYIIKGAFPQGEDAIAKDVFYSWYYAFDVIKKRFPKCEALMATDPFGLYKKDYEKAFKVKL